MSGDIERNPGPEIKCNSCKQSSTPSKIIKCENCKNNYHISCNNKYQTQNKVNAKNFTWVCPNQNCKPNYENQSMDENYIETNNKYTKLQGNEKKQSSKKLKPKNKERKQKVNKDPKKNTLWNELTTISPKQYMGDDICFKCQKRVIKQTTASCTKCERKAHMKCTNMSRKQSKSQHELKITCKLCSKEETEIQDKIDIKNVKYDERPKTLESIKKGKNELLIMHLNARSLVNKIEDIQIICRTAKPDILCITETWLNESVPQMH